MLNVALVGLLAGSLLSANPTGGDGDKDGTKSKKADAQESVVIVRDDVSSINNTITSDTYALGRTATEAPFKIWASYGYGEAEEIYDTDGSSIELNGQDVIVQNPVTGAPINLGPSYTSADIVTQRAIFGAEINPISFSRFQLGVGAQVSLAKNDLQFGEDNRFATNPLTGQPISIGENDALSSDFSIQNVKIYGTARGKVLGVHGGYILDLGDEPEANEAGIPTDLPRSDNRDAINVGLDFDYPIPNFRLFGGMDTFILLEDDLYPTNADADPSNGSGDEDIFGEEGDWIWNFVLGGGFRVSFFEIGAAAQIVARDRQPVERNDYRTIGTQVNEAKSLRHAGGRIDDILFRSGRAYQLVIHCNGADIVGHRWPRNIGPFGRQRRSG